jgi:hypothetical protein
MKAWIGPALAAAQTAHERRGDAAHNAAAQGETAAEKPAAALAPRFSTKAGGQVPGSGAFMTWGRRWRVRLSRR